MHSDKLIKDVNNIFYDCSDYVKRIFVNGRGDKLTILYIVNLCDKKYITDSILKPLSFEWERITGRESLTGILASLPLSECTDALSVRDKLLSGNAVLIGNVDGEMCCFAADAKSEDGRSISEPLSETVVRGPRQGFVENAMVNVTLIRKIIKSDKLKVRSITLGDKTRTDVKVLYYKGAAREDIIDALTNKLSEIKLDSCVDSGYLELALQSSKFHLFSCVGNSEKPDKVASKILGGRIAVICDGSPVVLTVPYLFTESIQSAEDYLKNVYYATFIRLLRFFAMMISAYLPALYVAIHEFHKGALPYSMYKIQMQTRSDIPFDIFTEMLAVLIIFEIIREAGLRMPKAIGDALSIVGGLILGDAAIKAGITSETVIVIAALTGICNFMNPTYMNANVILRFTSLIFAKIFGFFGISTVFLITLCILCSKTSFGVPYMSPFSPVNEKVLRDTVIMKPYASQNEKDGELS